MPIVPEKLHTTHRLQAPLLLGLIFLLVLVQGIAELREGCNGPVKAGDVQFVNDLGV